MVQTQRRGATYLTCLRTWLRGTDPTLSRINAAYSRMTGSLSLIRVLRHSNPSASLVASAQYLVLLLPLLPLLLLLQMTAYNFRDLSCSQSSVKLYG